MADALTEALNDPEVHKARVKAFKAAAIAQPLDFEKYIVAPRLPRISSTVSKAGLENEITPAEEAILENELKVLQVQLEKARANANTELTEPAVNAVSG